MKFEAVRRNLYGVSSKLTNPYSNFFPLLYVNVQSVYVYL